MPRVEMNTPRDLADALGLVCHGDGDEFSVYGDVQVDGLFGEVVISVRSDSPASMEAILEGIIARVHGQERARADAAELEVVRLTADLERTRTVARGLAEALEENKSGCLTGHPPCDYGGYPRCKDTEPIHCSRRETFDRRTAALAAFAALNLPEVKPCQSQSAQSASTADQNAEATSCATG
jgi:hypothetical protein